MSQILKVLLLEIGKEDAYELVHYFLQLIFVQWKMKIDREIILWEGQHPYKVGIYVILISTATLHARKICPVYVK